MNNTTGAEHGPNQVRDVLTLTINLITLFLGILGNVLVLLVIIGRGRKNNAYHFFIANLAISDLAYLIFYLAFNTYGLFDVPKGIEIIIMYCHFVYPLHSITYTVGILTLTSMAMYRCYFIVHPFKTQLKNRTVLLLMTAVWCLSISLNLPIMIVTRVKDGACKEAWSKNAGNVNVIVIFILQLVLPVSIIIMAYVRIALDLLSSKTARACINHEGRITTDRGCRENRQVVRAFIVVVILFIACLCPLQVVRVIDEFGREIMNTSEALKVSAMLSTIHACMNPVVYGSLIQQFRRGFIKYFSYCICPLHCLLIKSLKKNKTRSQDKSKEGREDIQLNPLSPNN